MQAVSHFLPCAEMSDVVVDRHLKSLDRGWPMPELLVCDTHGIPAIRIHRLEGNVFQICGQSGFPLTHFAVQAADGIGSVCNVIGRGASPPLESRGTTTH